MLSNEKVVFLNKDYTLQISDDISIVVCGEAGQGIQTIDQALTHVLKLAGYNVFSTKEYMSRIRGGSNSTEVRVSSDKVNTFVDRIDILIPLNINAIPHLEKRISDKTLIIGEKEKLETDFPIANIPFSKIASEVGGKIYANSVAIGVILGMLEVELSFPEEYFTKRYETKGADIVQKNIVSCREGYEIGQSLLTMHHIKIDISRDNKVNENILLNGGEAVSLGAIAGGCNFVSSYPMSPSTPVLTSLAKYSHDFDIIVEQAEDEIAAINMALGAWYAGGRALVTTSGGGFALMCEGISLAGMIETPVVIHLAQRPGPATGLPTRTEQGDIELALYAGHGEFPRIIFAPGSLEEAFYLTQKAFNLADKYQVPVVILTDQYIIDSFYNIPPFDQSNITNERHIVKTEKDYKRFKLTESGISPRGIPGYGEGIVCVDSDEHSEDGYITEDLELREKMVDKRLKKLDAIKNDIISPSLIGNKDYSTLIVCWGSNLHAVKEALNVIDREDFSALHFSQIYPIHYDTASYLEKAENTILIENNATAQFGKLIKLHTGLDIDKKVLKYKGSPFSVEEIVGRIVESLE